MTPRHRTGPSPTGLLPALAFVMLGIASAAWAEPANLWVTDDAINRAYQVDFDGGLLGSFPTEVSVGGGTPFPDSPSGIAMDHSDDSLWVVFENPPRLANYTELGDQLGDVVSLAGFFEGPEGVAVAIDPHGETLWVVDDPEPGSSAVPTIRRITRDGIPIPGSSIPTWVFDGEATSPQGIAVDPYDGSLWLTDNAADSIYNIDLAGNLLDVFHSPFAPGNLNCEGNPISAYNTNPQGISVDRRDGTLWVTDRLAQRIYHVTRAGAVLSSFCGTAYDAASLNPSGVAFDAGLFGDLGAASGFAALSLDGATFKLDDRALIDGDAGVGPRGEEDFEKSVVTGRVVLDPTVARRHEKEMLIGGASFANLQPAVTDARALGAAADVLPATQTFGEIKRSAVIDGTPGLNVIEIRKVELKGSTLTLRGDAGSEFVLRIDEKLKLEEASAILLEGGLRADRVLVTVRNGDIEVKSRSQATGRYLSLDGKTKVEGDGLVVGAVLAGERVEIKGRGRVLAQLPQVDVVDLGAADGFAALSLDKAVFKLDDDARIDGDAGVGPRGEQDFEKSVITGRLVLDPDVAKRHAKNMVIGDVIEADLRPAVIGARRLGAVAAALPASQSLGEIKDSTVIEGTPGVNVIEIRKVELDGETLTLRGEAGSEFVLRVGDRLKLERDSAIVLEGGLQPDDVLFYVPDGDIEVKSRSRAAGIFLAIAGKAKVEDASLVQGSVLSGDQLEIKKNAEVQR